MKKKLIPTLILIILFLVCFNYLDRVLQEKTTYGSARNIPDEEAGKIDVMILGASHVMYGINPYELWDRYGIAAYDLTTQQQPIYAGRILLDHALEKQKPKLVVFDVIMALNFGKVLDDPEIAANMTHLVLDPLPFSAKKIRQVLETEEITAKNEMIFPIIASHSRLQQGLLSYRDWHDPFTKHPHVMKGYKYTTNVLPFDKPDPQYEESEALPAHLEKSFRDLIEYCLDKDLPLLLLKTPVVSDSDFYMQLNRVREIADEYGIPFLDTNLLYEEMELDFGKDFADKGHLNVNGARKTSACLADYIHEHYALPDHRGEDAYKSWEEGSAHFHALTELPESNSIPEYIARLSDPNLLTIVALGGSDPEQQSCLSDADAEAFRTLGLSRMPRCSGEGAYYAVLDGGVPIRETLVTKKSVETDHFLEDRRFVIYTDTAEADGIRRMVNIGYDKTAHQISEPGLVILVWDKDTMSEVDAVALTAANGYAVSRDLQN